MHEGSLHSFNVAFQRELPGRFTLDLAYVGNRGHDTQTQFNENAATVVGQPGNNGRPLFLPFGKSADVTTWIGTKTEYNSLQAKLDRRFSGGLLVTSSYTLGRGLSYVNGDSNSVIATPADIQRSWARTDQDRLHSLVESFLYQLPFGPDRPWLRDGAAEPDARRLAVERDFHVPVRLADRHHDVERDAECAGQYAAPDVSGDAGRARRRSDRARSGSTRRSSRRRRRTPSGTRRETACSTGRGTSTSMPRIAKLFTIGRDVKGEFRVDIFNVTNTPHFNNPNGDVPWAPTFGQITSTVAGSERTLRFGFRLMF